MKAYQSFNTRHTPQNQPIPGSTQKQNNAGGHAWQIDKWQQLDRFLILGSEGGTYYVGEQKLTADNATSVMECVKEDGIRTVQRIVEISKEGRAPKNDPALFALAMCSGLGDVATRRMAFDVLPEVARIGTHLFHFAEYCKQFRGRGKLFRNGIQAWYQNKEADNLAYQAVKYQQRDGWSHRDLLRLAKPVPATEGHNDVYGWIVGKNDDPKSALLAAYEKAKVATSNTEIINLISEYGLTREMIPTEFLGSKDVWGALLEKMPYTAMIRNLGKMTDVGLLTPMSSASVSAADRLRNEEGLRKARVHPLQVLVALRTYESGGGHRGKLTWDVNRQIVDALDEAFYLSFGNVEPSGKRTMLALDVSGSMTWGEIAGMPSINPRVGSAAMAMITARTEPNWMAFGFSHDFVPLSISPRQRLDDICRMIDNIPYGATDCALPMLYAMKNNLEIDAFIVYTDSETWFGNIHPAQALQEYRRKTGINAKMIVVGMVANRFSIADPNDPGMLDIVGFDTATPNVMSGFVAQNRV